MAHLDWVIYPAHKTHAQNGWWCFICLPMHLVIVIWMPFRLLKPKPRQIRHAIHAHTRSLHHRFTLRTTNNYFVYSFIYTLTLTHKSLICRLVSSVAQHHQDFGSYRFEFYALNWQFRKSHLQNLNPKSPIWNIRSCIPHALHSNGWTDLEHQLSESEYKVTNWL